MSLKRLLILPSSRLVNGKVFLRLSFVDGIFFARARALQDYREDCAPAEFHGTASLGVWSHPRLTDRKDLRDSIRVHVETRPARIHQELSAAVALDRTARLSLEIRDEILRISTKIRNNYTRGIRCLFIHFSRNLFS